MSLAHPPIDDATRAQIDHLVSEAIQVGRRNGYGGDSVGDAIHDTTFLHAWDDPATAPGDDAELVIA